MAGIIAQINRANWERKKGFRKQLASDKSNVHINWFPDDYDFKVNRSRKKSLKAQEKASIQYYVRLILLAKKRN